MDLIVSEPRAPARTHAGAWLLPSPDGMVPAMHSSIAGGWDLRDYFVKPKGLSESGGNDGCPAGAAALLRTRPNSTRTLPSHRGCLFNTVLAKFMTRGERDGLTPELVRGGARMV